MCVKIDFVLKKTGKITENLFFPEKSKTKKAHLFPTIFLLKAMKNSPGMQLNSLFSNDLSCN